MASIDVLEVTALALGDGQLVGQVFIHLEEAIGMHEDTTPWHHVNQLFGTVHHAHRQQELIVHASHNLV